ncbi:hypothetical protein J7L48_05760, partial [bacterium]|nr:hypothetical protein [bacterium]
MKKSSIFFLLFLIFAFIYSEETIPQILIEGTEIEDVNIEDTGNIKIKLKDIDDGHAKKILKEKKEKVMVKTKNQYEFKFAFGNNIYTMVNFQGNVLLKKLNLQPSFSYYHNYPYIRDNYFERFSGGLLSTYNEKTTKISFTIKEYYTIYQYAVKEYLKENYFNSKLLTEFYPSSDLYIKYNLGFN